nr:DNA polymerase III subunit gamma and tau [Arcanobacterium pluranimalium]
MYRRYRPQTFQEVIGQEHVTEPLMAALEAGRTTHAYLFSGPRGCGKTTSARILARALNCAEYPTDTPCGVCESCRELSRDGSGSLDVVELDAASHGGVDDARELREQAGFAPVRDRFKIFIIDEAHMVSNQGFNALLKLVEEPPPHVKFIFATTEPEKVIGTIRSRTHHYPFRLVPPPVLENYLAQLCAQENISAGHDLLSLVVRAGTGSVRDTLSVLDQIIGGSDGVTLDYDSAVALLGYTSASLLDDTIQAISAQDGAALFGVVDAVVRSGHDPRRFVEDLLQRLRDLVIIALAGESVHDVFVSVPDDQYALMVQQAQELGARRASRSADLVNEALSTMAGATAPRLQLELLCARLIVAQADAVVPAVPATPVSSGNVSGGTVSGGAPVAAAKLAVSQPFAQKEPSYGQGSSVSQTPAESAHKPVVDPRRQPMPSFAAVEVPAASAGVKPDAEPSSAPTPNPAVRPAPAPDNSVTAPPRELTDLERIEEKWNAIIAKTSENPEAAKVLATSTGVVSFENNIIVIGFVDDESARVFNFSHPTIFALAHAVYDETGLKTRCEGCFVPPEKLTSDAESASGELGRSESGEHPPKDEAPQASEAGGAAITPYEPYEPDELEEYDEPEQDPAYDSFQADAPDEVNADPAGVLAPLVDGITIPEVRVGVDPELGDTQAQEEPALALNGVDTVDSADSTPQASTQPAPPPQAMPPANPNVPFYAQNMPAPPPLTPSFARDSEPEKPAFHSSHYGNDASVRTEARTQAHTGKSAQDTPAHMPVKPESEWDEVSLDDPEISQSNLVGINVVLDKFDAKVIEEISHEAGA